MRSLLWFLYQAAVVAALVVAAPVLLLLRGRHYLAALPGRLGRHREPPRSGWLWLHAVSVGEVAVAATLARGLPPELPLLVTTVTPTGQERARAAFRKAPAGSGSAGPGAAVAYLPFELSFAIRRFFDRYRPRALVLVEGDYWPLLLAAARRRGLPVVVVNGRLSDRSFPRLRLLRRLVLPLMLDRVDHFGVQTATDRDRLLELGVPEERITVTGNLKYESPEPPLKPELAALLRRLAGGRPILVAGSTMAGEEEEVAEAFALAGGGERALLLVAPRHPERFGEVAALLARRGLAVVRRSSLAAPGAAAGEAAAAPPEAVLLDTLGELAAVYRVAQGAFIGGTLVGTGGHNPLEAARFQVPVAVGPSMENFRQMAEEFDAAGAWRRVADGRELGVVWRHWLEVPEAGRQLGQRGAGLIAANQGSVEKTREVLAPVLAPLLGRAAEEER